MYEVFINNKRLVFDATPEAKKYDNSWQKISSSSGMINAGELITLPLNTALKKDVVILSDQMEKQWQYFFKDFKLIEAAGGLVQNKMNQFLFIFRNNKWDLPKGKIEKKELADAAAIREVMEETGIDDLVLKNLLHTSYHIYELKKQLVLKKTYWYVMYSSSSKIPIPQEEEGITEVKWM
jgi:hypothetical protein